MGTTLAGLNATAPTTLSDTRSGARRRSRRAPPERTLDFKRVYILPTRQGMGFAVVLAVMLMGSINYDNALGYVLCFLLASVSLVSMLHACRNFADLSVRAADTPPVFAGDHARFAILLDNRRQGQRYGLLLRMSREARRDAAEERVVPFGIAENGVQRVELPLRAERRGWYEPGKVTVASRFPFGLFRAWSNIDAGLRCLVYPRPGGSHVLPPYEAHESGDSGARGRGQDDFSGLRDYAPGDSPRHIHWKAVAREQGVPVKLFSGASAGEIVLRWQDAPGADTEARLSQLCRWILEADVMGLRYGLSLPGTDIAPDMGDPHRHTCLRALALFGDPEDRP